MSMTRKEFCGALAGGTVLLLFSGCGGGGGGGGGGGMTTTCGASIADNHLYGAHTLVIAKTDLDSTVDKVYNIQGMADHNHTVTLTVAMLGQLKAGSSVMVTSTSTASATEPLHSHVVTVSCP